MVSVRRAIAALLTIVQATLGSMVDSHANQNISGSVRDGKPVSSEMVREIIEIDKESRKRVEKKYEKIVESISHLSRGWFRQDISHEQVKKAVKRLRQFRSELESALEKGGTFQSELLLDGLARSISNYDEATMAELNQRITALDKATIKRDILRIDQLIDLFTLLYAYERDEDAIRAELKMVEGVPEGQQHEMMFQIHFNDKEKARYSEALSILLKIAENSNIIASSYGGSDIDVSREIQESLNILVSYLVYELVWDLERLTTIVKETIPTEFHWWRKNLERFAFDIKEIKQELGSPAIDGAIHRVEELARM
ncbi:MAG: hypothetical protein KJ709_08985 [Nanoarchaeota archaeon]|nr:hypothetical protein [Nanoarchaeota archaeon]